ncbi:hypothetical protein A1O1_04000 [Capronia coronata CBS 617.96]|uniref:Zn(2)-C6 fungal-type domain-containing protein n=1 Tax=Capronia coronata CBS 617.96 TaxID=1182541 RepID=W9Z8S2_9EURO|nr:uncharacterized protein A1O1_04000 [Capronia coronata CBS 617.96]EXJ90894.1 hypothetical protein A1O1_04000 [Capronia coronata CBS 617.96]
MIPRFGRNGPRSKQGCTTCRTRKVKCDERRPLCARCAKSQVKCEWDKPARPRRQPPSRQERGNNIASSPLRQGGELNPKRGQDASVSDESHSVEYTIISSPHWPRSDSVYSDFDDTPLWPTLSTAHIPLSNSVILDHQAWECFNYIPSSVLALYLGKPWKWSMLSYVHSTIARQEPGVMRAFVAVAAMEMSWLHSPSIEQEIESEESRLRKLRLRRLGLSYYRMALKDLSVVLERAAHDGRTDADVDALFAIWFLILNFERYQADLTDISHVHLSGIRSFLSKVSSAGASGSGFVLPPASQQLLFVTSFHDINLAMSNVNAGQLALDLFTAPPSAQISQDHLFDEARVCLPKIYGSAYPVEEYMDDIENYRALNLINKCQKLKLAILSLGIASKDGPIEQTAVKSIAAQIENLGMEFCDLIAMSRVLKASGGRRVVYTIYFAVMEYDGVKILHSCLEPQSTQPLDTVLADLLDMAHKLLAENPKLIYRCLWSLTIALLKTRDPIHRDWIRIQLSRAGSLIPYPAIPGQHLQEVELRDNPFLAYDLPHFTERLLL